MSPIQFSFILPLLPPDPAQRAAFVADLNRALALVSGRPGVCDGTVGPGVTNLVSGVAEAWAASTPLISARRDRYGKHPPPHKHQGRRRALPLRPSLVSWLWAVAHPRADEIGDHPRVAC